MCAVIRMPLTAPGATYALDDFVPLGQAVRTQYALAVPGTSMKIGDDLGSLKTDPLIQRRIRETVLYSIPTERAEARQEIAQLAAFLKAEQLSEGKI